MSTNVTAEMIQNWKTLDEQLKFFKKLEMEARIEICDSLLEGEEVGTHNFVFDGIKVKAKKSINISIVPDELEEMFNLFSDEEKECIVYKPSLSLTKYKHLKHHDVIDECLVSKPATPTLTFVGGQ